MPIDRKRCQGTYKQVRYGQQDGLIYAVATGTHKTGYNTYKRILTENQTCNECKKLDYGVQLLKIHQLDYGMGSRLWIKCSCTKIIHY